MLFEAVRRFGWFGECGFSWPRCEPILTEPGRGVACAERGIPGWA